MKPTVHTLPTLDTDNESSDPTNDSFPGSNEEPNGGNVTSSGHELLDHVINTLGNVESEPTNDSLPDSNEVSSGGNVISNSYVPVNQEINTPGRNIITSYTAQNDTPASNMHPTEGMITPSSNVTDEQNIISDSNILAESVEIPLEPRSDADINANASEPGTSKDTSSGSSVTEGFVVLPEIIKTCTVKLVQLKENELLRYLPATENSEVKDDVSPPEFPSFTQSGYVLRERNSSCNKTVRRSVRDRKVINYVESSSEDENRSRQHKKVSYPRPGSGPSRDRIRAQQHGKTVQPSQVELSQIGSNHNSDENTESEAVSEPKPVVPVNTPRELLPESTPVLKLRGAFKTTQHGVKHFKRKRWFKCSKCEYRCNTVKELNIHYRGNHSRSLCDICYKPFINPMALKKHRLSHTQLKYPCRSCEKTFPYESQLKEHRIKHRRLATHKCNRGDCPRVFKRKSDLDKHVATHDEEHKCPDCVYSTNDVRLLRQHSQRHLDEGTLSCPNCGQQFKFSTQRKRHIDNKVCEDDKSDSPVFD